MSAHMRPDVLDPPDGAVRTSPVLQIFADSADVALAAAIARVLQEEGLEVVGGAFDPQRVFAVIVIWSPTSLASPAMIAAARAAAAERPIVPVCVCDARPPSGFGDPAPLPLDDWSGDRADPRWRFVLDELELAAMQKRAGWRVGVPAAQPPSSDVRGSVRAALRAHAGADDAPDAEEENVFAAPARPRRIEPRPAAAIDLRTAALALAAVAMVCAFAVLASLRPRHNELAAAPAVPVESVERIVAPAATAGFEAARPEAAAPIAATVRPAPAIEAPAATPPILPAAAAPNPTARAVLKTPPAPSVKPAGRVDPLAALIVRATDAGRAPSRAQFRDCASCPPLVRVAPGRLATPGERQIAVARSFALGAREVTFDEWDACVVDGGCRAYRPSDAGWGRGKRPVINVSFEDAVAYVDWLSARTGARYRLPTDEEFTFAAGSAGATAAPESKGTRPADSGPKDLRGAAGLLGNVWEWTSDCTRWTAEGACAARVVKGGAWNTGAWRKTPQHAHAEPQGKRDYDLGFRVARDL